jgi:hypothetical protein
MLVGVWAVMMVLAWNSVRAVMMVLAWLAMPGSHQPSSFTGASIKCVA